MEPETPLKITPTSPPLSRGRPTKALSSSERKFSLRWLLVVLAFGVAGIFVFLVLPEVVRERTTDIRSSRDSARETFVEQTKDPEELAPYANLEREKAREEATVELASFVELQEILEEEMNIDAWGTDEYERVKELASVADRYFVENEYPRAMEAYRTATSELQKLIDDGRAHYTESIADGQVALDRRDEAAATIAYQHALTIVPGDPIAANGHTRATLLPRISTLFREFDRSLLRSDLKRARTKLNELHNLDAATKGLTEAFANLLELESEARYNRFVSEGFAALQNKRFGEATSSFDQALEVKPGDSVAIDGLNQTKQNRLLMKLDGLRSTAELAKTEGRWADAVAAYDRALLLDRSVRYARDGREDLRALIAIIKTMDRYLDDPHVLSLDEEYAKAKKTHTAAANQTGRGPTFDAKKSAFRTLMDRAGKPLPLVLVSDSITEVSIYHVGRLGTFERHELNLRPGRYTLLGSSDGCRDVRMTIVVEPAMRPVSVSCQERI